MSFSIHFPLSNFEAGAPAADAVAALEALKMVAVEVVDAAVDAALFCELSSTAVAGEDETVEVTAVASAFSGLAGPAGEEKKDVIEALALGFLVVDVAMSAALRLSGVVIVVTGAQEELSCNRKSDLESMSVAVTQIEDAWARSRYHVNLTFGQ